MYTLVSCAVFFLFYLEIQNMVLLKSDAITNIQTPLFEKQTFVSIKPIFEPYLVLNQFTERQPCQTQQSLSILDDWSKLCQAAILARDVVRTLYKCNYFPGKYNFSITGNIYIHGASTTFRKNIYLAKTSVREICPKKSPRIDFGLNTRVCAIERKSVQWFLRQLGSTQRQHAYRRIFFNHMFEFTGFKTDFPLKTQRRVFYCHYTFSIRRKQKQIPLCFVSDL